MELNQVKRMAAKVMKVGINKISIQRPEEAIQAMTKDDVRTLVVKKAIIAKLPKPASRVRARKIIAQKKKGRQLGTGTKRGKMNARLPQKKKWMGKVRALRTELVKLKEKTNPEEYRGLYNMIKGGYFRDKGHLKLYMTEKKMWAEKAQKK